MTSIFTANQDTLTLHIRITKKCNADCSYCSSFEPNAKDLMSLENLEKSMAFLVKKIIELKIGGKRKHVTVQYLGGELLTVSTGYLTQFTNIVQSHLSSVFENFRHGCQSNLIGNDNKIKQLINIFNGNLGTSFDNFTDQRTVNKDSKKYKIIFMKNLSTIKKTYGKNISGVIVLDKKMSEHIHNEIFIENKNKNHLTVRPVFVGGSPVEQLTIFDMEKIYIEIFNNWFLKQNIIIEPFFSYFQKRLFNISNKNISDISGCPSQHNCAMASMNMEPDGSIYVCQDMADSKKFRLGNTITQEFNNEIFEKIKARSNNLDADCISCSYFKECQGGCMSEAIEQSNNIYGKTFYCSVWKKLFFKIDEAIHNNDITSIQNWLNKISKY